ncbi:hypothetical protein FNV43_RR08174 [Rhamnella rubrinervis]|uniref:60S ribosomal protein L7a n=1 Tax=Rhamnella rubrinervis TaxID=2594499 RepID=A0A8K0MNE6_9ROSA|nr:hypothetical protein FNV43_RR08174 [Rhamnella rubrinervis]
MGFVEKFNNKGNHTYKLGYNEFSDLTTQEFLTYYIGYKKPTHYSKSSGSKSFMYENLTTLQLAWIGKTKELSPLSSTKVNMEKVVNQLFEKRPKQFGIEGALPLKRDLTRFVKWPMTVQIQRKRRILRQRLKVPPALNQFTKTLDKNLPTSLFKMLLKYRPEDKAAKKECLLKRAQAKADLL